MRVFEALANELKRLGVRDAFTLMSEEIAKLIVELIRRDISIYTTRHEHVAVGMADGYARASGKVGIAMIGRGPGLTNAINALVTATKAGTGIVVLAGDTPIGLNDPNLPILAAAEPVGKYVDQAGLLSRLGITHVMLRSPDTAAADLVAVFNRARSGDAVVVNMPTDVLDASAGSALAQVTFPGSRILAALEPKPEENAQVADLVETTFAVRRPLVLAGHGAVRSGASKDLIRLGDLTGAIMGTSLKAKSYFKGNPYDIGVVGTFSNPMASELLAEVDLVLAFGASLNQFTTYRRTLFPKARVVHFDADPGAFGRYYPVDVGVVGDARLAARALADELERRGHCGLGFRRPELATRIAGFRLEEGFVDKSQPGALDPRAVFSAVDRMVAKDRNVVVDGGHHNDFSIAYLSVPEPSAFLYPSEYFAVGNGLGNALGAAVARRDRLTVLDIGDGGLMMTLADLDTAVRYNLPLLVIVSNDGGFGSEVHFLRMHGFPDEAARYDNPSFEAVARAIGMDAFTAATIRDLDQLQHRTASLKGPLLVDCKITTEVRSSLIDFVFAPASAGPNAPSAGRTR